MNVRKKAFCLAAVLLAVAVLLTCLAWLPMGGRDATPAIALETAAQSDAESGGSGGQAETPQVTAPTAVASYDFTSSGFDATGWSALKGEAAQAGATVTVGNGLYVPGGFQGAGGAMGESNSYGRANPLKGKLKDGFSVIVYLYTGTDKIDEYTGLFGFTKDSTTGLSHGVNNFFFAAADGVSFRLNKKGPTNEGEDFYDIIGGSSGYADLALTELSQYILTVDGTAITVYKDGDRVASYDWTAGGAAGTYRTDTVSFVNEADWFMFGRANNIWGNPDITVEQVAFYSSALTADEIAAINASYADLTERDALLEELDNNFVRSNYDRFAGGWAAAYGAFTQARANAEALSFLTSAQEDVDEAVAALQAAYQALEPFKIVPDLTDGLAAAFPLDSEHGGQNLVAGATGEVLYMTSSNGTEELSAQNDSFITHQGVSAAKLYDAEGLSSTNDPNPYADRKPTSGSMGLSIPQGAFNGVTKESGLSVTVSAYIENFNLNNSTERNDWGRIFQLGTSSFSGSKFTGQQIFVSANGHAACDVSGTAVFLNSTAVCELLLRQWYGVTITVDRDGLIYVYVSGYLLKDGAVCYTTARYECETTPALAQGLIEGIIGTNATNWIGRSFWAADSSVIGAASNLSVYDRALSAEEVGMLHATGDLSTLVAA